MGFRTNHGLALVAVVLLAAGGAAAQDTRQAPSRSSSERAREDDSIVSLRGSLGMTASPETFAMTLELPVRAGDVLSVGPLFQMGFSDDDVFIGTSLQLYLTPELDGDLEDWQPYAHLGMGVVYMEDDDRRPGRDEKDTDFLLNFGTGIDYRVSEEWSIGTAFLFNTIPGGAVGNRFVWGWQILTLRYAF